MLKFLEGLLGKSDTGKWGEKEAARHLRRKGYYILGERVRLDRRDELDLVARDGEVLVFVEVKTRRSEGVFGRPSDAVNRKKRRVISRAAVRYLKRLEKKPQYIRFDVVEVIGSISEGVMDLRHIENAFSLSYPYRFVYG
mgnify:CR=1 FL=1